MILKAKIFLRRLLFERNYWVARFFTHILFSWQFRKRTLVLIYQMGKVGSWTLRNTLNQHCADKYIGANIHMLSDPGLRSLYKFYYGDLPRFFSCKPFIWNGHVFQAEYMARNLQKLKKIKIITLVRDPVGRTISMYFQHYKFRRTLLDGYSMSELIADFWQQAEPTGFLYTWMWDFALNWFDRELKDVIGVDVYATPFSYTQGYQIYQSDLADVLLIRVEDLGRVYKQAFKTFLDVEINDLVLGNVGEQKDYKQRYQDFKDQIVFDESFLDEIYQSRLAQHFYTPVERDAFKKKWLRR